MTTKKRPPKQKPKSQAKGTATPRTGQDRSTPATKEAAGATAKDPDYDEWKRWEYWPADAAISLLLGWEPAQRNCQNKDGSPWTRYRVPTQGVPSDLRSRAEKIRKRLEESSKNKNTTLIVRRREEVQEDKGKELPWIDLHEVEPHSFVKWANDKKYTIPPELRPLLETEESDAPAAVDPPPPGQVSQTPVHFMSGRWPGKEEVFSNLLKCFSQDNRPPGPGSGFAIEAPTLVLGGARTRWEVYRYPRFSDDKPYAVIRAWSANQGLHIDIRTWEQCREAVRAYLKDLVAALERDELEVLDSSEPLSPLAKALQATGERLNPAVYAAPKRFMRAWTLDRLHVALDAFSKGSPRPFTIVLDPRVDEPHRRGWMVLDREMATVQEHLNSKMSISWATLARHGDLKENCFAVIVAVERPDGVDRWICPESPSDELRAYLDELVKDLDRGERSTEPPGTGAPEADKESEGEGARQPNLAELALHIDDRKLLLALYRAGGPLRYGGMMETAGINKQEVARAIKRLSKGRTTPLVYRITNGKSREGFWLTKEGEPVARELAERSPSSNE